MQVAFALRKNDIIKHCIKGTFLLYIVFSAFVSYERLGSFNEYYFESNSSSNISNKQQATTISTTTKSSKQQQKRILMGIFTDMENVNERKRRHLIRNTYLDFDRIHNTTTPHRSCSLKQFLNRYQYYDDCQLIYTFVCGIVIQEKHNIVNVTSTTESPSSLTIDPSQFPNRLHETDLLFLKLDDVSPPTDHEGGKLKINREQYNKVQMIFQWYKYTKLIQDSIDYVALTDTEVMIKPIEFWNNTIFLPEDETKARNVDTTTTSDTTTIGIYAGRFLDKRECNKKPDGKCQSLMGGNGLMRRFVILSQDLVSYIIQQEQQSTTNSRVRGSGLMGLLPQNDEDAHEVVVANLIYDLNGLHTLNKPSPKNVTQNNNNNNKVQIVSLDGIKVVKTKIHDYLEAWDSYKDNVLETMKSLVSYDPDEQTSVYPRIIFGIFTMDSPIEKKRRNVIRETYLRYYHDDNIKKATKHNTPNRICSLSEYRSELDPKQQQQERMNNDNNDNHNTNTDTNTSSSLYCQMVYAFVMGSNPDGPKELVDDIHSHLPLTVSTPPPHLSDETDIIHLNIRENMKEGKSQTWLKYALNLVNTTLPFDYIGKIDSDTLLLSHQFLNRFLQTLPHSRQKNPYNIRLYAGGYRIWTSTNGLHLGPAYMGGCMYVLSLDLANYVVGPSCNRSSVAVYSEDQSMGNFVHTHPMPIHRVRLNIGPTYIHPIKTPDEMKRKWIEKVPSASVLASKLP